MPIADAVNMGDFYDCHSCCVQPTLHVGICICDATLLLYDLGSLFKE